MSNEKIKLTVEVYASVVEFHEIILTKEEHEKMEDHDQPEHITDYISKDTLMFTEESDWNYEITKVEDK